MLMLLSRRIAGAQVLQCCGKLRGDLVKVRIGARNHDDNLEVVTWRENESVGC